MTRMMAIELDWAYEDGDPIEDAMKYAADHGLRAEVVNPNGPGGGWPAVVFTGTAGQILDLVIDYGDEDLFEYAEEVES